MPAKSTSDTDLAAHAALLTYKLMRSAEKVYDKHPTPTTLKQMMDARAAYKALPVLTPNVHGGRTRRRKTRRTRRGRKTRGRR